MAQGSRNYMLQRNYEYDSHDEKHVFNGLTEEEWKARIRAEWSPDVLKANHVTIIFHDEDKENGIAKSLHAHAITNEKDTMSHSNMLTLSKCSCVENCTPIRQENLANAYRYLLHITEQAMKDKKHIYSENELVFLEADAHEFGLKQYHDIIVKKHENEDLKNAKDVISKAIKDIQKGVYNPSVGETMLDRIISDEKVAIAMMESPSLAKKVKNAVAIQEERNRLVGVAEYKKARREYLASLVGDEHGEYRKERGITKEECLQAQIDIQKEQAESKK